MKFIYRLISYPLIFVGLMLGFSSKVVAQYGVMVMQFKFVGEIKSAVCEQSIEDIEVVLVNDASGAKTSVRTDKNGQFNFLVRESFFDSKFTLNISDVDDENNFGEFVSKTVNFKFDENSEGFAHAIHSQFNSDNKEVKPLKIFLDYKNENPCIELQKKVVLDKTNPVLEIRETEIEQNNSELEENDLQYLSTLKDAVLYPNPNDGCFKVEFYSSVNAKSKVSLFDINGSIIDSFQIETFKGQNILDLSYGYLSNGQYILLIKVEEAEINFRIIIKK